MRMIQSGGPDRLRWAAVSLLVLALAGWPAPASADLVRLTNDDVIEGKVVEDVPEAVTLRLEYGLMRIPRERVRVVLRSAPPKAVAAPTLAPAPDPGKEAAAPVAKPPTPEAARKPAQAPPASGKKTDPPKPGDEDAQVALAAKVTDLLAQVKTAGNAEARKAVRAELDALPTWSLPILKAAARGSEDPVILETLKEAVDAVGFRSDLDKNHPELVAEDPNDRRSGLRGLAQTGDARLVPTLLRSFANDPADQVRLEALRSMGPSGDERVIPALLEGLKSTDPMFCGEASVILTAWASDAKKAPLMEALLSAWETSPAPRPAVVVQALVTSGNPRSLDVFTSCLCAPEPEVRVAAVDGLVAVKAKQAEGRVQRLLGDPEAKVRERAAAALGTLGGEEDIRPLIEALKDGDRAVVTAAGGSLQKITGEKYAADADVWNLWLETR